MKSEFRYEEYAEAHPDLADHFGSDNEADLRNHFYIIGRDERRGMNLSDYAFVDSVQCSDQGDIFVSGWADRRVFDTIDLTVQTGYVRYTFTKADICWYRRPDVNALLGDHDRPSGFIAILRVPETEGFTIHSSLVVAINNMVVYRQNSARWLSPERFLTEAMGACALLADRPVGETLENGKKLYRAFAPVWKNVLDSMKFTNILAVGKDRKVKQSIIITIYRKADMLLVQLSEMADFLSRAQVEVVVVLNEVANAHVLAEEVMAFCQLHEIAISIYACSGNSGFSAGNNYGASVARGDVLVFMNPDIFPSFDSPERAFGFFTTDPGEALHGAMLYYGDGLLMHSGMYVVKDLVFEPDTGRSSYALRVEHFGKGLSHHISEDPASLDRAIAGIPKEICIPSAALWKIRKERFFEVGGLPTDYIYAYYEDAAFGLEFLKQGFEVVIDHSARWLHLEGVGKSMPPHVRTFMWLNRCLFSEHYEAFKQVVDTSADQYLL